MSFLHSNDYVYDFSTNDVTNELKALFFVHPTSFKIWRAFPHVLMIDATYKTNKYNMPFIEIVGVTSTGKTFCIAFAFIITRRFSNVDIVHGELQATQIPSSIAIAPVLPIEDPKDSLIMGNEDLSTIPEKKSDQFIKSSVEDPVPIPSESEDTSGSDSEYDDFSAIDAPRGKSMTFSNPLFDSNDDFTSSDDESLSDEDVPEDNVKIYSNPLFEFDDDYISSDVNPLFDEVLEDIEGKVSYDPNLDEPTLLVTPLAEANEDECFNLRAILMRLMLF
uniref:MULE transposase domain-containing protein n=1 Tax=Tanacetum cinerariifolium TaxID=118510 RepID=A0A6L2L013_TANCI|nr:hypothetical protein [Tanacetum cinerariifolium]